MQIVKIARKILVPLIIALLLTVTCAIINGVYAQKKGHVLLGYKYSNDSKFVSSGFGQRVTKNYDTAQTGQQPLPIIEFSFLRFLLWLLGTYVATFLIHLIVSRNH